MNPESARTALGPRSALRHEVTLDGLRGLAVAAVVAYHLGVPGAGGGFLGVSLFFSLSGFLITNLLLAERESEGKVALGRFWARRARRLLPAAMAGIALAVAVAAVNGDPSQLARLPGDVVGALGYVANWRFVLDHSTYQAGYQAPSPLLHYWSLAIEEQLYLFLPLLVVILTRLGRGRRRLGLAVGVLMVASAAVTLTVGGGADPNRVYFGTDTRMFELLAGVLLAVVIGFPSASTGERRGERGPLGLAALGGICLAATVALWAVVAEGDRWLYRGGLCLVAALSCGLIAAAVRGAGPVGLLRWRPLAALGRGSYGVYVYHWPIFLLLDHGRTGLSGVALAAVRLAATAAVATASYHWLEMPIRQQRWRWPRPTLVFVPVLPAVIVAAAVVLAGEAPALAVAPAMSHPVVVQSLASASVALPVAAAHQGDPGAVAGGQPSLAPLRRVLFMGDSLVQQAFPTFAARLRGAGIDAWSVGGPGLSLMSNRGHELAQLAGAVAADDPDVVVLESCCGLLGTDARWVDATGAPVPRAGPAFLAQWWLLAARATAIARSRGAVVLWVLGPPLHTNGWYGPVDAQVPQVNALYRALVACTKGAGVVDWAAAAAPGGTFVPALPDAAGRPVTIRMSDGFHFTPAGWDLLARVTLDAIARQWVADQGRTPVTPGAVAGGPGQPRRAVAVPDRTT